VKCKAGRQTLNSNGNNIQAPSLLCGVRNVVLCKICNVLEIQLNSGQAVDQMTEVWIPGHRQATCTCETGLATYLAPYSLGIETLSSGVYRPRH
jgi:hypothetical protein